MPEEPQNNPSNPAPPAEKVKTEDKPDTEAKVETHPRPPMPPPVVRDQARASDETEKLRRDLNDLRDRLNNFREKDLFESREKVTTLNQKFWLGTAIVIILAAGGIKSWSDLDKTIHDQVNARTEATLKETAVLLDKNAGLVRAVTALQTRDFEHAILEYQDLNNKFPEDELIFSQLIHSYAQAGKFAEAVPAVDAAMKKDGLRGKYTELLSYNNAGYILLLRSIDDPRRKPDALSLLGKALEIGEQNQDPNRDLPLHHLTFYYAMNGDATQARTYGLKYRGFHDPQWEWDQAAEGEILKQFQKVRSTIIEDLRKAFAK
jgi:tetratricopeptide (TPR) repeat protein